MNNRFADIATGHDIAATIFIECSAMRRKDGDPDLQPVDESGLVIE
ncbi:hypothetical protein GG851_14745 [Bordetella petrii]|nr:hypothetical protein [Bordetella petrii]